MTIPCEFTHGKCEHCGDTVKGECEGWNATDDAHIKLRAAAKLALYALESLHWSSINIERGHAIAELRKAGIT